MFATEIRVISVKHLPKIYVQRDRQTCTRLPSLHILPSAKHHSLRPARKSSAHPRLLPADLNLRASTCARTPFLAKKTATTRNRPCLAQRSPGSGAESPEQRRQQAGPRGVLSALHLDGPAAGSVGLLLPVQGGRPSGQHRRLPAAVLHTDIG